MKKRFQVVGIGNALVDMLCHVDENFLEDYRVAKGVMQLIDLDRASELSGPLRTATAVCGGSAANTIAGLAQLGHKTAYVGKVKKDRLGCLFSEDIRSLKVTFETELAAAENKFETGRCIVLVTPDGERSMNTYLGASEYLAPSDIDADILGNSEWLYLEGYRFDGPDSQKAFVDAVHECKKAGGRVALTLSDPFCVERHREAFRSLLSSGLDILFCNRQELLSLYQTQELDIALDASASEAGIVACTLSENGATIARGNERFRVEAYNVDVVDVTGAGDLFAAGFLHGVLNCVDLAACARFGCAAASEIVAHIGARPESNLDDVFRLRGLH
ncbi:MAG: adenosine kinase [Albidovulum sp.]|nr:adenosine kinase [Albidovulum sp.]MDE0533792.1 adenosine kinase [Albidovulum sp.]